VEFRDKGKRGLMSLDSGSRKKIFPQNWKPFYRTFQDSKSLFLAFLFPKKNWFGVLKELLTLMGFTPGIKKQK